MAQIAWSDTFRDGFGSPYRTPILADVPHRMSCACVYGPMNNDPRCGAFPDLGLAACPHLEKP